MKRIIPPHRAHCDRGFTLVELLVVIGIIALLIAVLLPALNKARESARQVQCLSNMRQISIAIISLATDHKGYMPGQGGSGLLYYSASNPSGPPGGTANADMIADWIAWQRNTDPITGNSTGAGLITTVTPNQYVNITNSAIAKYLGAKSIITTDAASANAANPTLESIFRCPSDNLPSRKSATGSPPNPDRYSYSMNQLFTWPVRAAGSPTSNGVTYSVTNLTAERDGFVYNGKMSTIHRPSEHILLICEDELTIDDAVANLNPNNWVAGNINAIAARHELKLKKARSQTNGITSTDDARGNVTFCDGHGEFMSRRESLKRARTGRPDPDPPGF